MHTILPKTDGARIRRYALLALLSGGLLMFFVTLYTSRGGILFEHMPRILFEFSGNYYSDFFDCLHWLRNGDPSNTVIVYPPSACIWLYAISHMFPMELLEMDSNVIRGTQLGMLIYLMFVICTTVAVALVLFSQKKGRAWEKTAFIAAVLLSRPALFGYDRGNIILLSLVFLLLFLAGKDSENKLLRELSFVCLAFSAGIKIYPALFGFLLVKERRWKETARLVVYGVLVYVIPYFMFDGWNAFRTMARLFSSITYSAVVLNSQMQLYNCSIYTAITTLLENLAPFSETVVAGMAAAGTWTITALCAAGFILSRSKWKPLFFLTALCILVPNFSQYYNLVFFIAPLLYYLDSDEPFCWTDLLCMLGFFFVLTPWMVSETWDWLLKIWPLILAVTVLGVTEIVRFFVERRAKKAASPTEAAPVTNL